MTISSRFQALTFELHVVHLYIVETIRRLTHSSASFIHDYWVMMTVVIISLDGQLTPFLLHSFCFLHSQTLGQHLTYAYS